MARQYSHRRTTENLHDCLIGCNCLQATGIDLSNISTAEFGGRCRPGRDGLSLRCGVHGAACGVLGGVLRHPPKAAQVSWSNHGLPEKFEEYFCGHWLVWLCH